MFRSKGTRFIILVLALTIIAPPVRTQQTKQAEGKAMVSKAGLVSMTSQSEKGVDFTFVALILAAEPLVSGVPLDAPEVTAALRRIRSERLRAHTRFLAGDLLEGRGTGTRGHEIAARYVAAQFEAIGLEAPLGRYLHPVPIRSATVDRERTTAALEQADGSSRNLVYETDFVVAPDLVVRETTLAAEVVSGGHCVSAPELGYDDFKAADMRGKFVACTRGAPASFSPQERSTYSSFDRKWRSLAANGAIGMIDVRTAESDSVFPWRAIIEGYRQPWMDWIDSRGTPGRPRPIRTSIVVSTPVLKELAPGTRLRVHQAMIFQEMKSPNVLGVLRGSDPALRDEYVVYTAHIDHLGIGTPVNGDAIYNGASDNASGTAALIEIARAFTSMPVRPRRSILFVGTTGEEVGLVGSDFFVHDPPVPIGSIVANINIDGIAAGHPSLADVVAIDGERSTLGDDARRAAQRAGLELSPDPAPERLLSTRGEQSSFTKLNIPAVWLIGGDKSSSPSVDVAAFKKWWWSAIYHTPADDMSQRWNWSAGERFTHAQFLIGYIVANRPERPRWK